MLRLMQFRYSPYNEKVRWALDLARVPHQRMGLLPGPHLARVKKLTGRSSTPVLVLDDGTAIDDSPRILDWLERHHPGAAPLPRDPRLAQAARDVERRFDLDLAPRGRRAVLDALLRTPRYFARVFGDGRGAIEQLLYAALVPLAAPLVRKGNGITGPAAVADGLQAFDEGLDWVAQASRATGYLVGDVFTRADLAAASALAMCVDPPGSPMARPQPRAAPFDHLVRRYATHPGSEWVRGIYRRHRQAATDFEGRSPYP